MLKPGFPSEPGLVGRNLEIEQLLQHLGSALNGKGITVFVCGEAGIGKTRLVNEFLNHAKKMGAEILCGWCLSEAAIPYFPFTEAFNTYISTTSEAKAKSTMTKQLGIIGWLKGTELTEEPKTQELFSTPEIERDKTFEAVARVLLQLSAQKPLVLFLDDLHWADHLSLALVHYLSRKCRNSRLLIIGTYRPEETVPTEERKLHPLEETMFSMSREDLLIKMELKNLKRNDLSELVRSIFHASADEAFVEKLYKETEGNPLFALETLNLLVDEGFLSEKEGQWIFATPMEKMGIPSKIQEVITRRITRLGREERRLLDLAAVYGHSFNPNIMSKIMSSDVADVLQTLVEIEQRHMLIRPEDSTFEFTHHKIREVIYENLPGELRRVYHLKTATCLEQVVTERIPDSQMADIALHYVEGGALEKAFEHLLKLGEKAVEVFANLQAIEHLNKALEATQKVASLATSENLAKIYMLRGRAWLGQGEVTRAIDDFNLLLRNVTSTGDEAMIAETHYWIGYTLYMGGKWDDAKLHLAEAIEMAQKTANRLLEGRSLYPLGYISAYDLDTFDESLRQFEESSRICEAIGDKVQDARNRLLLGELYVWKCDFNLAEKYLNEALALTEETGDRLFKLGSVGALAYLKGTKGEYNDAISTVQECLQLSREYNIGYFIAPALSFLGWFYHDLSNIELAMQYHNQALNTQNVICKGKLPFLVDMGTDYLYKKDYENAEKYFAKADSIIPPQRGSVWRFKTRILLGFGEISLAKGDYTQALESVGEALFMSEKAGAKKYIAKSLKLKAEVLAKMGRMQEAIELMEKALEWAQEVGNPPLLWQIHYSLGLLLEIHLGPQEANEHYAEAIALIEETASKLKDASLKNVLLTAPQTKAIQDAYAKTKPTA